jgi:hypothetical protein
MKNLFNKAVGSNKYGYDEIVDSSVKVISMSRDFQQALSDGVQVTDAMVIWKQYPNIQSVVNDRKIFAQQFADLTPEESQAAYAEIATKTGLPVNGIDRVILTAMKTASRIYRLVDHIIDEGSDIIDDLKGMFAKKAA